MNVVLRTQKVILHMKEKLALFIKHKHKVHCVNVLVSITDAQILCMIHRFLAVVQFEVILYICAYASDLLLVCSEGQELACLLKRLFLIS